MLNLSVGGKTLHHALHEQSLDRKESRFMRSVDERMCKRDVNGSILSPYQFLLQNNRL